MSTAAAAPRTGYVFGSISDHFWIILCPVFSLAAMYAAWSWIPLSDTQIYALLFAFVVTGHHMPGWLRAFGEPGVYAEHKAKLWVSFLAIPAMIVLPSYYGLGFAALVVVATFDLWHVAMQQHGFGRIYAAKEGDRTAWSAWLDLACVLVWYATVVFWSDSWSHGIASSFRSAGLPWLSQMSIETWWRIKAGLAGASGMLLALYVHRVWRLWRGSRHLAWRKHLLHAAAFGVLAWSYQDPSWYRAQSVQNLFHALQYFFIVWAFSHLSVERNPEEPRAFYRLLFRYRWGLLLYLAAIGLYGWGGWWLGAYSERYPGGRSANRMVQVLGSIGMASLLLHFYVDSFIWKVRSKHVQQALDIEAGGQRAGAVHHVRGALHAVGYFGLPLLVVFWIGHGSRAPVAIETLAQEARLYPRSAQARFLYGVKAMNAGDLSTARRELEAALSLAPRKEGPALFLADLDVAEGRPGEELEHLRAMVRASPTAPAAHQRLGWALVARGLHEEGERSLARAVSVAPGSAEPLLQLARLYLTNLRQPERAVPLLEKALRLDPSSSAAACALAQVRVRLGQREAALDVLLDFLRRNPLDGDARDLLENLKR